MGLGLSVVSTIPKGPLSAIFRRKSTLHATIVGVARRVAARTGVDLLVPKADESDETTLRLVFGEEPINLDRENDFIVLSARTISCGPGYHAMVVDLIDQLNNEGFVFRETDDHFDETGYLKARDYSKLQDEHAHWLKALAIRIAEDFLEDSSGIRLSVPVHAILPQLAGTEIVTPGGVVLTSDFVRIASAESNELLERAMTWFPWWNKIPAADDFMKIGKSLMWVNVPWHVPANAEEEEVMRATLHCFEKGKTAGGSRVLPHLEIKELRDLLEPNANADHAPLPDGLGYRRRLCSFPVVGGWSVVLPGYWYEGWSGATQNFYFGDKRIFATSYSKEKMVPSASGDWPDSFSVDDGEEVVFQRFAGLRCRVTRLDDDEPGACYVAEFQHRNQLLLLQFNCENGDWFEAVLEIVKSVQVEV